MKIKDLFSGFIEYAKANNARPRTILEYRRLLDKSIINAVGDVEINEINYKDVGHLIEISKLQGETGPQKAILTLRSLLSYASKIGIDVSFPWYELKVPSVRQKPVEYLNKNELDTLRTTFQLGSKEENHLLKSGGIKMVESRRLVLLRTRTLIELILSTGLRISEALSISLQDINWSENEITIINAKTRDCEIVYPSNYALAWIKQYLAQRESTNEALFVSDKNKYPYKGDRMGADTAKSFLYQHCKRLPESVQKHIHHHIFRKTFVTTLFQEGLDLPSVKAAARHNSERTTLRYYGAITLSRVKRLQLSIMDKLQNVGENSIINT